MLVFWVILGVETKASHMTGSTLPLSHTTSQPITAGALPLDNIPAPNYQSWEGSHCYTLPHTVVTLKGSQTRPWHSFSEEKQQFAITRLSSPKGKVTERKVRKVRKRSEVGEGQVHRISETVAMPVNHAGEGSVAFLLDTLWSNPTCMSSPHLLSKLYLMKAPSTLSCTICSLSFIGAFTDPRQESLMMRAKVCVI